MYKEAAAVTLIVCMYICTIFVYVNSVSFLCINCNNIMSVIFLAYITYKLLYFCTHVSNWEIHGVGHKEWRHDVSGKPLCTYAYLCIYIHMCVLMYSVCVYVCVVYSWHAHAFKLMCWIWWNTVNRSLSKFFL